MCVSCVLFKGDTFSAHMLECLECLRTVKLDHPAEEPGISLIPALLPWHLLQTHKVKCVLMETQNASMNLKMSVKCPFKEFATKLRSHEKEVLSRVSLCHPPCSWTVRTAPWRGRAWCRWPTSAQRPSRRSTSMMTRMMTMRKRVKSCMQPTSASLRCASPPSQVQVLSLLLFYD